MLDDLRAACRSLRSSKTVTVAALAVLALGIGAGTAIFSVVDAVVLRALPFDQHDRLVAVGERRVRLTDDPGRDPEALSSIAPQNYLDWSARQDVFESMAAIAGGAVTLREPGAEPEDLRSLRVTAGFFDVLRTRPARGRAFSAANEIEGRNHVAILSDGLWRRRFGADPSIVGRTIPLERGAYEVLGVMPPEFQYPIGAARPTDLWLPYVVPPDERVRQPGSHGYYLQAIARLKPGASRQQAQAQMDQIAAALELAHPDWNKGHRAGVRPLRDHLVGAQTKSWMLMLLGAVGIVLLITCANVANLLLARSSAREREIGLRMALGATRGRVVGMVLANAVVLVAAGLAIGGAAAWYLSAAAKSFLFRVEPTDPRAFAAAIAVLARAALAASAIPARRAARVDPMVALRTE